jgi:hypothetical protein
MERLQIAMIASSDPWCIRPDIGGFGPERGVEVQTPLRGRANPQRGSKTVIGGLQVGSNLAILSRS